MKRLTLKRISGLILASIPLDVAFAMTVYSHGFTAAISLFSMVAAVTACCILGVWILLESSE